MLYKSPAGLGLILDSRINFSNLRFFVTAKIWSYKLIIKKSARPKFSKVVSKDSP